ncbi:hypothetical protein BJF90_26035 [Pseudonocardia sp. CNS-004]|nr:hypothetical protein BJF90_26035 [Pseudonocardia sp. CNS-004]
MTRPSRPLIGAAIADAPTSRSPSERAQPRSSVAAISRRRCSRAAGSIGNRPTSCGVAMSRTLLAAPAHSGIGAPTSTTLRTVWRPSCWAIAMRLRSCRTYTHTVSLCSRTSRAMIAWVSSSTRHRLSAARTHDSIAAPSEYSPSRTATTTERRCRSASRRTTVVFGSPVSSTISRSESTGGRRVSRSRIPNARPTLRTCGSATGMAGP